jgi:hypothetical protein
MLGNLFLYAANRATQGVGGNIARHASWGGFAIFMLLTGTIFSLMVAFWLLEGRFGAPSAGVIIAAGCFVVGLICLSVPHLLDVLEARNKPKPADALTSGVATVQEGMTEAVDYFGSLQVVSSAFLLGFNAARQLKHRPA